MSPEVRGPAPKGDRPSDDTISVPPATYGYDEDLFGEIVTPPEKRIPRKNSREYEPYIRELTLPNGLSFWSLAPGPPGGTPPGVESIYALDRQGLPLESPILVDLYTGQEYDPPREVA